MKSTFSFRRAFAVTRVHWGWPILLACAAASRSSNPSTRSGAATTVTPLVPGSGGALTPGLNRGLDAPLDGDTDYPDKTEVVYLTGSGTDDAIDWDFMISSGERAGAWSTLPVPSNWEMHGFGTLAYGNTASTEVGTYRRSFDVPLGWKNKHVFIVFEGSLTDTTVTINGASAGPAHQGGFYRFKYDVTGLVRPGSNQIEVVVGEQSSNASVNAAEREADYWTFGGIFRPVYLEAYPEQSIERFAIDAKADGSFSAVVYPRGVTQGATLTARVLDASLAPVGMPITAAVPANATEVTLSGSFPGIQPWSAESPSRYRIALELATDAGSKHAVRENFGFRSVEVRPGDGIYVNGVRTVMRGVNRHAFWPDSGRALNAQLSLMDAQILKDMNMNAVRSSHYPQDKHFIDRADAIGLYVLDELAGWQSPPYETAIGRRLIEEMVTFNVNHPSILFWDNGNEGGWNTELDAEFARWDPQRRAVLHPWETFSGVNTDHYENYASTTAILSGSTIFMPTEFLHGLYDGGGGAGLEDYWTATLASRVGAGGFLWAFVDEAVQRAPGQLDTAGNAAPDGILGPHREKEGSYYTIRQIWSPVQIAARELPDGFDGRLSVQNRYDGADLDTVDFAWQLVRFDFGSASAGHSTLSAGMARTASIAPGATGVLPLQLPADRGGAQALWLDATDKTGRLIGKWSWMLEPPASVRAGIVPAASAAAAIATDSGADVVVTAGGTTFTFARGSGLLTSVVVSGRAFPLRNGPTLSVGTATLSSLVSAQEGNDHVITASYTGNLQQVVWRVRGDGWLALRYRYNLQGTFDFFGVDFDCAEAEVTDAEWLGRGPTRVWKNRMLGPWHDVWQREKNDAGPIAMVMDSPGLFLRLYTPTNGPNPRTAIAGFPARDISIMHGIAPIGDKFLATATLGPQSAPHQVNSTFTATVYFHFGPSMP